MTILEQYTDLAGKIRIVVELTDGTTVVWKFSTQPTTQQLEDLEASYIDLHQYDDLVPLQYNLFNYSDLIKEIIQGIKDNPTMTLNQFSNYISQKTWWQQATINFFMVVTAVKLSELYNITLSNYDNTTVFTNVRNWIVATPARAIAKIIFNE